MINLLLFFDDNNLKNHMQSLQGSDYTVITPSPMHADMSRLFFDSQQKFDVVTISNFIKTYTEEIFDEDTTLKLKRKSDLNLILASLWKIINKNASYELFQKSFTLLTDFRAFSLNEDVLTTILENCDDEIANSVLWFHRTIEQLELIDEHKSYFLISEKLREGNLPILLESEKKYIFMGFDFLTPAQIDMIQSLAIRNDVYIPFNQKVFEKAKDFDWIKWITRFDSQITHIDDRLDTKPQLQTLKISKNYLSKALKLLKLKSKDTVVVCSRNLDQKMIGEIPYSGIKFKAQTDLLYKEVSQLEEELVTEVLKKTIYKDDFKSMLETMYDAAVERQDFKYLKTIMLISEIFNEWLDLTDKNEFLSEFEIKVFMESLKLNTPRNSLINAASSRIEVESLSSLDKIKESDNNYFCATPEYGPIKSSVIDYSEDVQKFLATIGPIRRSEFEFDILQNKIFNKLSYDKSVLVIESNLVGEDAGWSEILSGFEIIDMDLDLEGKRESLFDYFNLKSISHSLNNYSASRLQTYLDCPQKYWHRYILKQSKRILLEHTINPMELGLIEHEVIETYLNTYIEYDENKHELLIKEFVHLLNKKIERTVQLRHYLIEIKAYTKKTIVDLLKIRTSFGMKFKFEKSIHNRFNKAIGSIDCFGESKDFNCLLDFKRGATSIPSQKAFYDFEKVQLWFYLNQIKLLDPDFLKKDFVLGYVNLGEPDKSLLFVSSDTLKSALAFTDIGLFSKTVVLKDNFDELFADYQDFEQKTLGSIETDKSFTAKPQSDSTCNYCDLQNICLR